METSALQNSTISPIKLPHCCHHSKFNRRTRVSPHTTGTDVIRPVVSPHSHFGEGAFWVFRALMLWGYYQPYSWPKISSLLSLMKGKVMIRGAEADLEEMVTWARVHLPWSPTICFDWPIDLVYRGLLTTPLNCFSVNKAPCKSSRERVS